MGRISKRAVDALKPGEKDIFLWDGEIPGFGVKVTPTGRKSYVFTYRLDGKKPRLKIGDHGPWTPSSARERAAQLKRCVDVGEDPKAMIVDVANARLTLEFRSYAERFIDEYLTERWPGSVKTAAALLRRHAVPRLQGKPLTDITRGELSELLRGVQGVATTRNTFAVLRKLFRWAVSNGDIADDPFRGMEAPPAPKAKDRVLSDRELGAAMNASERLGYPFGPFIRLLALTGQRRCEVAGMKWAELDRTNQLWVIPAARTKNKQSHDVPLSPAVVAELDAIAATQGDGGARGWPRAGLVFTTTGDTPVSGFSKAKARLDGVISEIDPCTAETDDWNFHDLRRTLATGLRKLGVSLDAAEAVINHVSGSRHGIVAVYQRYDYEREKREALNGWAQHIASIREQHATSSG